VGIAPHPCRRGQCRTARAITTQIPRAAAIPMPITHPRVADSGKRAIAASADCRGPSPIYASEGALPSFAVVWWVPFSIVDGVADHIGRRFWPSEPVGSDCRGQNSDLVRPKQDIRQRDPRLLWPMSRRLLRGNDCVRKEAKRRSPADRKSVRRRRFSDRHPDEDRRIVRLVLF
jgi:hypothetical protein